MSCAFNQHTMCPIKHADQFSQSPMGDMLEGSQVSAHFSVKTNRASCICTNIIIFTLRIQTDR